MQFRVASCLGLVLVVIAASSLHAQNLISSPKPTEALEEELAITNINFDDIIFYDDNSIPIMPNRYAGVSFYHYGTTTWLTHFQLTFES